MNKVVAPNFVCSDSEYGPCYSCSNLNKIAFLTKTKSQGSRVGVSSNGAFDHLPDEVLIRILNYIPPINMNNFITFIVLQMVSKRFRRCMADNKKILEEMTELVIGFHPDLPDSQYICHIGHFTLQLLLKRVKKITKVIVNIDDNWLCRDSGMESNQLIPFSIDRFGDKMGILELILQECQFISRGSLLVEKLLNKAEQFLESAQILFSAEDFWRDQVICVGLRKCPNLKNLKLSIIKWNNIVPVNFFIYLPNHQFSRFFSRLRSLEVLEISGYIPCLVKHVVKVTNNTLLQLHTVRFTNPYSSPNDFTHPSVQQYFSFLVSIPNQPIPLGELEIHLCAHSDNLTELPALFDRFSRPIHLKITFLPYFTVNKVHTIADLLENARQMNIDGIQISVTFKYSDNDREEKLAIVYNLLTRFDVPFMPEEEDKWKFIRGKLCVNLLLEKIEDESLICHPYPPPENQ